MTEETRKDARAKIVSLNVRYKSATVDEFIENHSYDVSKGGVFIKTATPFAPGTLLKFEIRIAGDVAVIGGVGRVVWKRDAAHATAEIPAGMGVKFIKLDDSSRATIEKLVQVKGDVKSAFDLGADAAPAAAAAGTPATEPKASACRRPPLLPPPQHPPQRRPRRSRSSPGRLPRSRDRLRPQRPPRSRPRSRARRRFRRRLRPRRRSRHRQRRSSPPRTARPTCPRPTSGP